MFMQHMLLGVWWVPFAAYLNNLPNIETSHISFILCSMAIGSMAAPLVGVIADRYIASEKLIAVLNLLVAVFLFFATQQTHFTGLMITVTLAMLCYMPTWSLTSSIAMTHISSEQFPRIRLIGTVGGIASGLFSMTAIHAFNVQIFDGTVLPLYCGAVVALIAAFFNIWLPKTPPAVDKSEKHSIMDIFGLRVISALKNRNFNWFVLFSFLVTIPFALFHHYGSLFLQDENFKYITVTMNWRQVAELFFLFITTSVIIKYGFKKAMLFGLLAMFIQYIALYSGFEFHLQWLYYIGLLPHGLIFGLFYIAGQVYTDKVVPKELKAQAQGFLSFVTWGVGIFAGNLINGWMVDNFKNNNQTDWSLLFLVASILSIVLMVLFFLVFKNPSDVKNENKN